MAKKPDKNDDPEVREDEGAEEDAIAAEDTGAGVEAPKARDAATPMTRRHVVGALVVGLLAGGGGGFAVGQAMAPRRGPSKPRLPPAPAYITAEPWNPRRGPDAAKVTLVLFTDIQCPFCERANGTIERIFEDFKDDVTLIVKNRTLDFHKRAEPAAIALLAAERQGKAWAMYDLMFANRKELGDDALREYARKAELDMDQFEKDVRDPEVAAQVKKDNDLADELGVQGTPTTFINGRGVRGAKKYVAFETIIKEELTEADKLLASGTPLELIYETRA
ncbi:MAG: thioredoxin domain-containing protein, partial [Polyangiaceae bacterium]